MLSTVTAQPGIFALGTAEHCYLEFRLQDGASPADLGRRLAGLTEPLTTVGGVNVVVGVRPALWRGLAPDATPPDAADFDRDLVGPDGFVMPATQHDAWVWVAGASRTAVFDNARAVIAAVEPVARVAAEVTGWLYRSDRDLTGFIDGTENPSVREAPDVATVPDGAPGAGASIVLHQLWRHDTAAWEAIGEHHQELAMGRTKPDSIELGDADMPPSAHVARTSVERDGEEQPIFRRNVAYGGVTDHGTVFVGFARDQWRLAEMLRRMAGVGDGVRCALTHYLVPLTGGYYVVPSLEQLAAAAT